MEQKSPHKLTLSARSDLTISAVTEVVSFDDTAVILRTELGTLVVQGTNLQLVNLNVEGGVTQVQGTITALTYEELRPKGGWLHRLLQ